MARRIPGEFVPSDVDTVHDPAIRAAGYKAELLFRRANEYSKRTKSDGVVPKYDLPIVGIGIPGPLAPLAAALVRVGLWQDSGDTWTIPKYLKWNLSQSEIADDKGQAPRSDQDEPQGTPNPTDPAQSAGAKWSRYSGR